MKRKRLYSILLVLTMLLSACNFPLFKAFASESDYKCEITLIYPTEADDLTVSVGDTISVRWTLFGSNLPYIMECFWRTNDGDGNWTNYPENEVDGTASFVPETGGLAYFCVLIRNEKWEWYTDFRSTGVIVKDEKEPIVNYTDEMVNDKVAEVVAACMATASGEYSRAKWLHDWLTENAKYDYTFTYYNASGVLLAGKGVCNSFSEAYRLLLNKAGISNKLVSGEANNGTWGGHAWNLVKIGGNWYHVDVTWDDGTGSASYFLKSDKSMTADHRWDASKYPACPYDWGEAPAVTATPTPILTPTATPAPATATPTPGIATPTPTTEPTITPAPVLKGDANGDSNIDIMDLVAIIDYIVSNTAPTSLTNADANGDGTVDIMDLVWIIDRIVGV